MAAGLWSPSGPPFSTRSRGTDPAEPCCPPPRSDKSSSSTSAGAGCHLVQANGFCACRRRRQIDRPDTKERRSKPRQLACGISNLLDDMVSQRPVPKYRSASAQEPDLIRMLVKGDRCACITQRKRQSQRVSTLRWRAAHQSWKRAGGSSSLIGRPPKRRARPANPGGSARRFLNSCCYQ